MSLTRLTIERIHQSPSLSGALLTKPKFPPNENSLAYLMASADSPKKLDLWLKDIQTGDHSLWLDATQLDAVDLDKLSDEEKARRERQRLDSVGITDYQWAPDSQSVLFNLNGKLYVAPVERRDSPTAELNIPMVGFITDERYSPKGRYISFVADQNLFLFEPSSQLLTQLTHDGEGPIKNAMADFIAQEEMARMTGYWWSPEDQFIAFTQVDESPVLIEKRIEIKSAEITTIDQRYAKAGTANVLTKLGICDLAGENSPISWYAVDDFDDPYFARGKWANPSTFSYQVQNRNQTQLYLNTIEINTGAKRTLLKEDQKPWINLHDNLTFLKDAFIWSSEASGFSHLYLYDNEGEQKAQLTSGDWVVKKVCGANKETGDIFFLATKDSPVNQLLYRTNISTPNKVERVTLEDGWHEVAVSKHCNYAADISSNTQTPPSLRLLSLNDPNRKPEAIVKNELNSDHPFAPFMGSYSKPVLGELALSSGVKLHYRLLLPKGKKEKAPLIVYTYAGPRQQLVRNMWFMDDRDLWAQVMVDRGFAILTVDSRGSDNRGLAFEAILNRKMGQPEVEDQVAACRQIIDQENIDPDRIGIFGWSYGGYMTLRSLLTQPDFFKVGVAVAPVSDWALYDTHYTERYMGKPQDEEAAYHESGCLHLADKLKGKLLIMHGMADDNVLYTHSTTMYVALQAACKPFDIMAYPGAKHGIYGLNNRQHLFETLAAYFEKWL